MSRDLPEAPILLKNIQDVEAELCAKSGAIAIYTLKNITNKLFFPIKAFDPGLKLLELTWPFCQYLGHISSDAKSLCLCH